MEEKQPTEYLKQAPGVTSNIHEGLETFQLIPERIQKNPEKLFQHMIVHHQQNHTDEEKKVREYLNVPPDKGWQQDAIIIRYPRQ